MDRNAPRSCPLTNTSHSFSIAAAHVEDAERPREGRQHKSVEPMEQRPRGHKPAVCPGYVAEAASQLVPAARLVHSLGKLCAMAKIRRFKLHGRAWSQR